MLLSVLFVSRGTGRSMGNDSRVIGWNGHTWCPDVPNDFFICDGGAVTSCVIWCDGHEDCRDGTDEKMDWCYEMYERMKVTPYCRDKQLDFFFCDHDRRPCSQFCNNVPDCEDGKDEIRWHCDHHYPNLTEWELIVHPPTTEPPTTVVTPEDDSPVRLLAHGIITSAVLFPVCFVISLGVCIFCLVRVCRIGILSNIGIV